MTSAGSRAILVASEYSAKFAKPTSAAASWRNARISAISGPLSHCPACGPRSEARVTQAS